MAEHPKQQVKAQCLHKRCFRAALPGSAYCFVHRAAVGGDFYLAWKRQQMKRMEGAR